MRLYVYFITLLSLLPAFGLNSKIITVGYDSEYQTIQEAVGISSNGDTIKIKNGVYATDYAIVVENKSNLKIIGEGYVDVICNSYVNIIEFRNCKNVLIENIHAVHGLGTAYYGCGEESNVLALYDCQNITIRKCELNGCGHIGIYAYDSDNLLITNNYIHSNVNSGISITKYNVEIKNIAIIGNRLINNAQPILYDYEEISEDSEDYEGITLKNNTYYPVEVGEEYYGE